MVQVLERRKILPRYLFLSFSLPFLLDFDSLNELVLLSGQRRMGLFCVNGMLNWPGSVQFHKIRDGVATVCQGVVIGGVYLAQVCFATAFLFSCAWLGALLPLVFCCFCGGSASRRRGFSWFPNSHWTRSNVSRRKWHAELGAECIVIVHLIAPTDPPSGQFPPLLQRARVSQLSNYHLVFYFAYSYYLFKIFHL